MKLYILLLFIVGCYGTQWKPVNDFKEIFKEYSESAISTISTIEKILDTSRIESELFLNNTYSKNPAVTRVTAMKTSEDKCFEKFIDEKNFQFSFQIQIYQLQIPLNNRIVDIRERLNNIDFSIDIYPGIAESKFRSCKSEKEICLEEINRWLQSNIDSLSCSIYTNCSKHSIKKRSACPIGEFRCRQGGCISSDYYCGGICQCSNCEDEPTGCTRDCMEFRCSETWRCISESKKCNGVDDCGDGSDEEGCPPPPPPIYTHVNCSIQAGDFLCRNKKCIGLEQVCDGHNDCGDLSDEGDHCDQACTPECGSKGGVCFTEPTGPRCLYECPPGTYETSRGCSRQPEEPLPTLLQVLEDTPRLIKRYVARLKFLKTKTLMALSKALRDVVKCKQTEFALLSKVIDFSTLTNEEYRLLEEEHPNTTAAPGFIEPTQQPEP